MVVLNNICGINGKTECGQYQLGQIPPSWRPSNSSSSSSSWKAKRVPDDPAMAVISSDTMDRSSTQTERICLPPDGEEVPILIPSCLLYQGS